MDHDLQSYFNFCALQECKNLIWLVKLLFCIWIIHLWFWLVLSVQVPLAYASKNNNLGPHFHQNWVSMWTLIWYFTYFYRHNAITDYSTSDCSPYLGASLLWLQVSEFAKNNPKLISPVWYIRMYKFVHFHTHFH